MNKEIQEKLDNLEKKFLEIKQELKNNPQAKLFPYRIIKAIKICNEYENIYNENTEITTFSLNGTSKKEKYQTNQLIIDLYNQIGFIPNFDFLKNNDNTNVDLYNFFNRIQINKPFDNCYILLLDNSNWVKSPNFYKTLYKDYLGKDISLMYQLQNRIQIEYWYHTNCKNYEGFIKKYRTITKIAKHSKELAKGYRETSMWCFKVAFGWFLLCCFAPIVFDMIKYRYGWQYSLPKDYFGEIFIFLSKLLFKLPSFVLCLIGVKFLYLFVQYKTEEREFSMLDTYLEKIPDDCKQEKAELVKQLAPHFFPDKKPNKISQGFLQELLLKMVDK